MQPVFRFAPSPNGLLHLGHAYSALLNQQWARRLGGRLLLRIDDIDQSRSRQTFIDAILQDLDWLGIRFDGEVRFESHHLDEYRAAAAHLKARGLLFACDCTRQQIVREAQQRHCAAVDPDGAPLYPGRCLENPLSHAAPSQGQPVAWRLNMAKALDISKAMQAAEGHGLDYRRLDARGKITRHVCDPARWGDVVLLRKDIAASYHLCVVVDDNRQGVTHVVRGRDLEAATDLHRLLQDLLGLPTPIYHHHDLVLDGEGDKLAKSRMSKPLREWRSEGASPASIRAMLGFGAD